MAANRRTAGTWTGLRPLNQHPAYDSGDDFESASLGEAL